MGFNYFNQGNIRDCCVENGKILVRDPYGNITSYECSLNKNLPWQINIFLDPFVAFVLYDEDKEIEYIGRFDGTISGYRCSDNLLCDLGKWIIGVLPMFIHIGYIRVNDGLARIVLDDKDKMSVFAEVRRWETRLKSPFKYPVDLYGASVFAESNRIEDYYIMLKGGIKFELPVWSIQSGLRIGACRGYV